MMSAGSENIWKPTLSKLRQGSAKFLEGEQESLIQWTFNSLALPGVPLCYIECEISGFGFVTTGLGDGLTFKSAATRALAEAWERLWMLRASSSDYPDIVSSNGFAAGPSLTCAKAGAQGELIERATLLAAWQSRRGWRPHQGRGLLSKIVRAWLATKGWNLSFFRLATANQADVLAGLARHSEYGSVFDTKYLASIGEIHKAEGSLIRSLLRAVTVQERRSIPTNWALADLAYPEDHMVFYRKPENLAAFEFLDSESATTAAPALSAPEKIKVVSLCDASTLPAVALAQHADWPTLRWGSSTIGGENPWPHPLA